MAHDSCIRHRKSVVEKKQYAMMVVSDVERRAGNSALMIVSERERENVQGHNYKKLPLIMLRFPIGNFFCAGGCDSI